MGDAEIDEWRNATSWLAIVAALNFDVADVSLVYRYWRGKMEIEWTIVEDRLPEQEIGFLVCTSNRVMALANYKGKRRLLLERDWEIQPYGYDRLRNAWYPSQGCVTHWMPLPDMPRVDILGQVIENQIAEATRRLAQQNREEIEKAMRHDR